MIIEKAVEADNEATDYLNARVNADGEEDNAGLNGYSAEQAAEAVAWSGG